MLYFLIYFFIYGLLGCFCVLVIENNVAMHIGRYIYISFWDSDFVFLNKNTEVELLDHVVALLLIFWGTSILFPIVASPIYIPSNSAQGVPFLQICTNTCYFLSFWW